MKMSADHALKRPFYVLLAIATLILAVSATAAASELATEVALLVGTPADGGNSHGVLVVPGAVIPVASGLRWSAGSGDLVSVDRLQKIADDLERSLRLSDLEVRYKVPLPLVVDERRELPPPSGSSKVRMSIQLLGFNESRASYDVQIHDGEQQIAHTPLSIERGKQAVVGGLDGDEAYLFLIIAPASFIADGGELPDGPVRVSGDIQPPLAIDKPMAVYTPEAKEQRVQGVVILETVIETDGSISSIRVLKGLPLGLSEAAVAAIKEWRFEPALLHGQPIAVYYNLTINFRLE